MTPPKPAAGRGRRVDPEARRVDRRIPGAMYGRTATEITGPLAPTADTVAYRRVLTGRQHATMLGLGALHLGLAAAVLGYLMLPGHLAVRVVGWWVLIVLALLVGVRTVALVFFAAFARDPIPMVAPTGLRVALLTTIVPGAEPLELVMTTLRAMRRVRHAGQVDVWLLDEGDDPEIRLRCAALGVRHFSRKGHPEWNQPSGPFRAQTKHGNHNAWRKCSSAGYDVVAQLDPGHLPYPNFLERTLGYFADQDTAFVVVPQVCANLGESFVAKGAAELTYLFHGLLQRGGNGHAAPLLTGATHLYRPAAFDQIDGYQDAIRSAHLTSLRIYAARNPATGRPWKGVYTPDILAVGEGPATYSDFFSQQKRRVHGGWEIATRHSLRPLSGQSVPLSGQPGARQRWAFLARQAHSLTTAALSVLGVGLPALYLFGAVRVPGLLALPVLAALIGANLLAGLLVFWFTQRFNLVEHERQSWGLCGVALELITAPISLAAAAAALAGRPPASGVPAKGSAATGDTLRTFGPHLAWAALAVGCLLASPSLLASPLLLGGPPLGGPPLGGPLLGREYLALSVGAGLTALICLAPVVQFGCRAWSDAVARRWSTAPRRSYSLPAQRRLGEVLVAKGRLSQQGLEWLLDLQATADGPWRRFGALAIEQGMITEDQLAEALQTTPAPVPDGVRLARTGGPL